MDNAADLRPRKGRPVGGELQSLTRGIEILEFFEQHDLTECRIEQVIAELDLPPTTVYRLVRVLKSVGFLENGPSRGTFRLGPRLAILGERVRERRGAELVEHVRPLLEELAEATGETVFLTLRSGDEVLYADVIDSNQELRVSTEKGKRLHIAGGASGKVILAFARPADIARVVQTTIPAYTPHTITDREKVLAELQEIRQQGYAVSANQTTLGICGISVPLLEPDGTVTAALTVSGPAHRMTEQKLSASLEALRRVSSTGTR